MMLFLAAAVIPAVGTMTEKNDQLSLVIYSPTVEWQKTFDRGEFDHFHMVRQTDDGGYIAVGNTEENDMYYVWLVKLDAVGNEEWMTINYDLNGSYLTNTEFYIMGFDVQQTSDEGYIIGGVSMVHLQIDDEYYWLPAGFLWKTDDTGGTEWLNHYYDVDESIVYWMYNVIEVEDGYVGTEFDLHYDAVNEIVTNQNGLIMKTDLTGTLLWAHEFDKGGTDSLSSVAQTSDGGFFLSGFSDSESFQDGAAWMVKTDGDGNQQWDKTFDGSGFEYTYGKGCCQTNDGGFIMNCVSNSYGHGGTDIWMIKTDASGNLDWDAAYGGGKNDYCWGMCTADSNGYALGICTNYGDFSSNKDDILIIETDQNGNTEWKLRLEEEGSQITRSICATSDGGYVATAMTGSFGSSRCDGVIVKIGAFDNQRPTKPATPSGPARGKPDTAYTFTTTGASDPDGDQLTYRWDWGDGEFTDGTNEESYTWTSEDKFEVRVMAIDEHGGESDWSDPLPFSTPRGRILNRMQYLVYRLIDQFPLLRCLLEA